MANENNPSAPLSALAAEACDLWQEHLSNYATDPQAKEELMRLMEPSRQMFAEWTKMVQNNGHGAGTFQGGISPAHPSDGPPSAAASGATRSTAPQPPSDDSALRLAQLSYRVADLEKRLVRLESRSSRSSQKTNRAAGHDKKS